jgi:hypothetical protein
MRDAIAGSASWDLIKATGDNAHNLKSFVEQAFHNPTLVHGIDLIVQAASAQPPLL